MTQPSLPSRFPRILPVGDEAVTVEFGDSIDDLVNRRVYAFADAVTNAQIKGVTELVPTYRSLLIQYDLVRTGCAELSRHLRELVDNLPVTIKSGAQPRIIIEVPVAYGGEFGPDLEFVAQHASLPADEVVRIHSHQPYRVYMLGFSPGFPYLGGVDQRIACPRLKTPRTRVAAGSVGIAETQTGVYPNESPGGWRIIGRTPVRLFDPIAEPPVLARPGAFIQFVPVDHGRFREISDQVQSGTYAVRVSEGIA